MTFPSFRVTVTWHVRSAVVVCGHCGACISERTVAAQDVKRRFSLGRRVPRGPHSQYRPCLEAANTCCSGPRDPVTWPNVLASLARATRRHAVADLNEFRSAGLACRTTIQRTKAALRGGEMGRATAAHPHRAGGRPGTRASTCCCVDEAAVVFS